MKPLYKYLVLPVACHALVCSEAMAKKDKSEDSDNKKSERTEDSPNKKRDQAVGPQGKRSDSGGKVKPQNNRPDARPKQQEEPRKKLPQQTKKKDVQPERKDVKPREDKPSNKMPDRKDVRPNKDDANPSLPNKRRDEDAKDRKKDNDAPGKRKDEEKGKGTKDIKPMDLPGKRPGVDKGTKDQIGKNDKDRDTKDIKDRDKRPNKPMPLPGKRPKLPESDRHQTKDIPKPDRKPERPLVDKKPDKDGPKKQVVVRPGQNTKKVRRVELENNNKTNNWWANNGNINSNNKDIRINNKNVTNVTHVTQVNNNFRQNVNWSTRRNHWGYNPWWNRPATRPWYGSSWNCGWSNTYYTQHYHHHHDYGYRPPGYYHDGNDVARAIGWGLVGWSLGAMIYDYGYRSYQNPYQARPVYISENTQVTYTEPITQVAVRSAPKEDTEVQEITRKSESLIAESQTAFKQRNYLVALELADKAIAASPGDGALHEYRALVLFALGKYGDAAGVLNPVLASGPGWDWSTMIALYDSQQTYTDQLQNLEAYTEQKPESADCHFLLGYHYMVCGHLDLATPQFDEAVRLMPKDSVSKELAELTRNTEKTDEEGNPKPAEAAAPESEAPEPEPVPLEKLTGTWVSARDAGSSITLTFKDDGKFTWSYVKDGKTTEFGGEYSMNDDGLLVLDSSESQMVANVELPQESELKFVLAGGPPEDPGLAFKKN